MSVDPRYLNYVYSFVFVCIHVHVCGWVCACHACLWRSGNSLCMSILSSFPDEGWKDQSLGPSWQHLAIQIPGHFVNHPPHNILSLTSFFRIHSSESKKTSSKGWAGRLSMLCHLLDFCETLATAPVSLLLRIQFCTMSLLLQSGSGNCTVILVQDEPGIPNWKDTWRPSSSTCSASSRWNATGQVCCLSWPQEKKLSI